MSFEGILSVKFCHKFTDFSFIVICCYLPPENSVWGRDSDKFFSHLTSELYTYSYADCIIICGDLNARTGCSQDIIPEIDFEIAPRFNLDETVNSHGKSLIDFLKATKFSIINGRITPNKDNFTYITTKGKSVVDYFLSSHDSLQFCKEFEVMPSSYLVEKFGLHTVPGSCKIPDHSLMILKCKFSYASTERVLLNSTSSKKECCVCSNSTGNTNNKVYKFNEVPHEFMNNVKWSEEISLTLHRLNNLCVNQFNIDSAYNEFCNLVFQEMDCYLKYSVVTDKKVSKRLKPQKPYWDNELTCLWKLLREQEKLFTHYKGSSGQMKKKLRFNYKAAENKFDKLLRQKKRKYNRDQILAFDELSDNNPKAFWDKLKNLGPKQRKQIPLRVKINETYDLDLNTIKNRWKADYESLYNGQIDENCDFYRNCINIVNEYDRNTNQSGDVEHEYINADITFEEIERISNFIYTDFFLTTTGVHQGDNLSPTLFALFINDLARELKELGIGVKINELVIPILLFADDVVLLAECEKDLQLLLDKLVQWCNKWKIKINESKSKIMHFRPKQYRLTDFVFNFSGNYIEMVSSYKYLGVMFDEHLTFEKCSQVLAESGSRALGSIISKFKTLKDCTFKTYEKLYNSGVAPILDYGSAIWGYKNYKCIDDTQNRAVRFFLGIHKFAPLLGVEGEVAWVPSLLRCHRSMISFWNRMLDMSDDRLTKIIFNWDYQKKTNNWSSQIRKLLEQSDQSQKFLLKEKCGTDSSLECMLDQYKVKWLSNIGNKPKLRTYKLFKHDFSTESYLYFNLPKWKRSILAQFRLGILPLNIETGRYKLIKDNQGKFRKTKPEERLCLVCNAGLTEDETHFLLECTCYNQMRQKLLQIAPIKNENFMSLEKDNRLKYLMNNCIKQVADFLFNSWEKRRELLYATA